MKIKIDSYPYLDSAKLFARVAQQPWAAFLDSGVLFGNKPVSKYASFDVLAIKPQVTLVTEHGSTTIDSGVRTHTDDADPLDILKQYLPKPKLNADCAYMPGAIGYFSYDLARCFEQLPEIALDDEQLPEMAIGVYHAVVVVDHTTKTTSLIYIEGSAGISTVLHEWRGLLDDSLNEPPLQCKTGKDNTGLIRQQLRENMTQAEYQRRFNQVRHYTIEGDCYQVNLSKRFSAKVKGDAWQTYGYLRALSPAPYGAYFNFPFAQVLSNSPESFIRCRDRVVVTSPIKGTRARDHNDPEKDKQIARQLVSSAKDRAENLIIVDLMRNDLSKCCELGSVHVPKLFALHSFANVHHLISTITGLLKPNLHSLDLLRSCFPGGSITGAPKIRAMQIIEELEPHRRGLYCGAIGIVGVDGSLETNIAIRTIVVKDGVARYSAGGGLVIDSNVEEEYQEVLDKASMMSQALRG